MIEIQSLDPKIWFTNAAYRYGIDLYHEGYVWEAHEVWEGLWKHTDRHSPQRTLLQALILNTAAQLKIQEASVRGAQILSKKAYNHLLKLQGIRTFMGLDLEELLEAMHRCYAPLWNCTEYGAMPLLGPPPRLKLIFPAL